MKQVKQEQEAPFTNNTPENAIIACEDMRVKRVVYTKGEVIPEHLWDPAILEAALRVGLVSRQGED